jgi:HEAT repeat protein
MPDSSNESLNVALAQLRSEDVLVQNQGVAAVIGIGAEAVPALLEMLEEVSGGRRAQVIYALSQIAAPEAAAAFRHGLQDEDERVRAYAAVGLARTGEPDALAALLQTLNDAPDPLHGDMTPAVFALAEMGSSALPSLLDLLMDENEDTRLHAQRALEQIIMRRHGFLPGQGFPSATAEELFRADWRASGDYDYSADASVRADAVEKWRRRLSSQEE